MAMHVSRTKIAINGIALLVLIFSGIYFTTLRPSDSSYESTSSNLDILKENSTVIARTFNTDAPPYFNSTEELDAFLNAVASYQKITTDLSESAVMQRGISSKREYAIAKDQLAIYGQSVKNTAEAVLVYYNILENCGYIRTYTPTELTDRSNNICLQTFAAAEAAPNSGFKSQFLTPYAEYVSSMVKIVGGSTKNKEAELDKQRRNIELLYRDTVIDYGLAPSPAKQIDKLREVVNQEKTSFIR